MRSRAVMLPLPSAIPARSPYDGGLLLSKPCPEVPDGVFPVARLIERIASTEPDPPGNNP